MISVMLKLKWYYAGFIRIFKGTYVLLCIGHGCTKKVFVENRILNVTQFWAPSWMYTFFSLFASWLPRKYGISTLSRYPILPDTI